ncbi:hypothetical protein H6F38_23170 [Paenibacillus sp. EKM208P]|nr:hypothetical protein H6F38_23170 [Paenibacillus sp. EKM208P]
MKRTYLSDSRRIIQKAIKDKKLSRDDIENSFNDPRDIRESLKQFLIEMQQIRTGELPCKTWREYKAELAKGDTYEQERQTNS